MATELNLLSGTRTSITLPASSSSNASNVVALRPDSVAARQELASKRQNTVTVPVQNNGGAVASTEDLQETVQQLNNSAQVVSRSLQFSIDEDTGITVITVRDRDTDEVIRQIPAEEMLKLARRMQELSNEANGGKGILLSAEA